jgi:hypothetical protein
MKTAKMVAMEKRALIVEIKREKKKYLKLIEQIKAHQKSIKLINQKAKPAKQNLKKLISKHYKLNSEIVIEDSTRFCWGLDEQEINEITKLLT